LINGYGVDFICGPEFRDQLANNRKVHYSSAMDQWQSVQLSGYGASLPAYPEPSFLVSGLTGFIPGAILLKLLRFWPVFFWLGGQS